MKVIFIAIIFLIKSHEHCHAAFSLVEIPEIYNSDSSYCVSISENRNVCGYYTIEKERKHFIWSPSKKIHEIPEIPSNATTIAINNKCQIIGKYPSKYYRENGSCISVYRGFIWDPNTGFNDLGDLGGGEAIPRAINNHGKIVGCSKTGSKSILRGCENIDEQHAFLWESGCMTDLGTLLGPDLIFGSFSEASAINDLGWIVGSSNYGLYGGQFGHKASKKKIVLWSPNLDVKEIPFSINNQSEYRTGAHLTNDGWFLIHGLQSILFNLNSSNYKILPTYQYVDIANRTTIYSTNHLFSNGGGPKDAPLISNKNWDGKCRISSMNFRGDIIGSCYRIKDQRHHAIILLNSN